MSKIKERIEIFLLNLNLETNVTNEGTSTCMSHRQILPSNRINNNV